MLAIAHDETRARTDLFRYLKDYMRKDETTNELPIASTAFDQITTKPLSQYRPAVRFEPMHIHINSSDKASEAFHTRDADAAIFNILWLDDLSTNSPDGEAPKRWDGAMHDVTALEHLNGGDA
ncbi:hypothetical protein CCMA1212_010394 [Trichoderma ghanense]|uniref:Uncharacterized protein n=1 Tax=Trichoderma ghanense TaxID=65468 RepID=A0ABY2GSG8_9HYPO